MPPQPPRLPDREEGAPRQLATEMRTPPEPHFDTEVSAVEPDAPGGATARYPPLLKPGN